MVIVGIILIIIGLSAITGISLFNFIVAVVLIVIGVRLIMGHWVGGPRDWQWHDRRHRSRMVTDDDHIDEVAVFSPLDKSFTSQSFKGGKIVMVFSGGTVDLSGVHAEGGEVHLEVAATFSGINIIIPKEWKVRSDAQAMMGGVNTYAAEGGDGDVTLVLHGQAVCSEIKVKK